MRSRIVRLFGLGQDRLSALEAAMMLLAVANQIGKPRTARRRVYPRRFFR